MRSTILAGTESYAILPSWDLREVPSQANGKQMMLILFVISYWGSLTTVNEYKSGVFLLPPKSYYN